LEFRPPLEAEDWNAQISLMTGMAAASLMLDAGVGILRTMPAPQKDGVRRFRRQARALGIAWPDGQRYGDFLRSLDRTNPRHLALIHEATALFRGAGYTPFDGSVPGLREHAAVASVDEGDHAALASQLVEWLPFATAAQGDFADAVDFAARVAQMLDRLARADRDLGELERRRLVLPRVDLAVHRVGRDEAEIEPAGAPGEQLQRDRQTDPAVENVGATAPAHRTASRESGDGTRPPTRASSAGVSPIRPLR